MLGAYVHGSSVLHRLQPGAKLLGLIGFSIVMLGLRGVPAGLIALGLGLAFAIIAGLRGRALWRATRAFLVIAAVLFAFQWWMHGWERGLEVVCDLLALILAASAVTASTRASDMLETVTWALGPLRVFHVDPERVALAFSLAIRAIPLMLEIGRETGDAARARGLERSPRARVIPFVLRSVAHAQATGDALTARGLDDD